uniref:Clu domain-containing protein n=1 Tax=Neobodo designis TaxID=312471 RepID=A0A7S1L710_NEODS|mmetsp:Transcript_161/g.621  ORF Transcript_161/g.621 Transcript_161/m.621 type:complete len:952 (+) Transcript_161:63-2918(+)
MGSTPSSRMYHTLGERGRFLTSRDFFLKRYVEHESERVLHQFYDEFIAECGRHSHSQVHFEPNEDFQLAVEVIDENPFERSRAIYQVSSKYLHDVMQHACHIVDVLISNTGAVATSGTFRSEGSGGGRHGTRSGAGGGDWAADNDAEKKKAGRSFTHRGFFYFLWNSVSGEKFGRTEVKGCRMLAELYNTNGRVPLAYHIKYKGRAITVMALLPITKRTAYEPGRPPMGVAANDRSWWEEWDIISMEVASALKLKSYEADGRATFTPPYVQRHNGLDGRRYFVANGFWLPRLPPPTTKRSVAQNFYGVLRPLALVSTKEMICARAFRSTSVVHEDRATIHAISQIVDVDIHQLAKEDTRSIVAAFRAAGYNYSMLGILLCSLLRNVAPPAEFVDEIITEMMARGIADYICDVTVPVGDPMRVRLAAASGATGMTEDADFDAPALGMDLVGESARFYGTAHSVLKDILEYEGDPPPREETATEEAVPLPLSTYGGQVIPHVYRKFRLAFDDADLWQAWPQPMRRNIYGRTAQLLGLVVRDGVIQEAVPILCCRSASADAIAQWCSARLSELATQLLLKPLAPRVQWEQHGPGLILLVRLNPSYWPFYEKVAENVERIDVPFVDEHAIAVTPHLQQLEEYVDEEWHDQKELTAADFDVQRGVFLLRLLRMVAAALHAVSRHRDALHMLRRGRRLCERVFEKGHSVLFSPQFRALSQQLKEYSAPGDISALTEMLRLTLKHCPLDITIALDYVTVALAHIAGGDMELAKQNLSRAKHIAEQHVAEDDARLLVIIANEADIARADGDLEQAASLVRPIIHFRTCPPGALRVAARILGDIGEPEAALRATLRAEEEEENLKAHRAPMQYVAAPTGGPAGTAVELSAPRSAPMRRSESILDTVKRSIFGAPLPESPQEDNDDDDGTTDEEPIALSAPPIVVVDDDRDQYTAIGAFPS